MHNDFSHWTHFLMQQHLRVGQMLWQLSVEVDMNKFISTSFVYGFHGCNKFWMQLYLVWVLFCTLQVIDN
jgi:hypothetical protein